MFSQMDERTFIPRRRDFAKAGPKNCPIVFTFHFIVVLGRVFDVLKSALSSGLFEISKIFNLRMYELMDGWI